MTERTWSAQRLVALRTRAGLSQAKLGDLTGFTRETINKLENDGLAKSGRTMTPHYAHTIAPALAKKLKEPVAAIDLLPPGADVENPADPLQRLQALEALVARLYAETARGFEHLGHRQHGLADQGESRSPGRGRQRH